MGGLAYMTGPPGRPLRAGASVIDVVGGLFGVIGVLAALVQRQTTDAGQTVKSALFENCVFLVGQHMAQYAVTGQAARPMPVRVSAWAIYDLFTTKDDDQVFVGVVTDGQWRAFCAAFDLDDLAANETYAVNNGRVAAREVIIPRVQALMATYAKADLLTKLESIGLPFAPIGRPEDMFEDPHMVQSGGLSAITLPGGGETSLPGLPIEMDGQRFNQAHVTPAAGADTRTVLADAGYAPDRILDLIARGVVAEAAA